MGQNQKGLVKSRYLRVSYVGEPVAQEVLRAIRRALKSAEESKCRGVILDLTNTERALSWGDRIRTASGVAALQTDASRPIPVAVVVPGDLDPRKLGTKAAARRGGRLNAFTSLEAAHIWLRTQ